MQLSAPSIPKPCELEPIIMRRSCDSQLEGGRSGTTTGPAASGFQQTSKADLHCRVTKHTDAHGGLFCHSEKNRNGSGPAAPANHNQGQRQFHILTEGQSHVIGVPRVGEDLSTPGDGQSPGQLQQLPEGTYLARGSLPPPPGSFFEIGNR